MRFWLKRAVASLGFLGLLAVSAEAQVPDPFAGDLAHRLAVAQQGLTEDGYQRAAGPFAGELASRETRSTSLTLRAGQDYRLMGVCDSRCGELDIRVYDASNELISEQLSGGENPIVHVRPYSTGLFTVEVTMARCGAARCWYAFNAYSR